MRYAQFYTLSTGYIAGTIPPQFGQRQPIEACGTNGVVIIDGRVSLDSAHAIAQETCRKRGYIGWRLYEGPSFTRSHPVGSYHPALPVGQQP